MKRNGRNPQIMKFSGEKNSLGLTKIYVLATGNTASASEMVINSLRGVDIEVVHIGETTNGKNVGMDLREKTIGDYRYELWPITFKVLNAKGFTDYADGFDPDHEIGEFSGILGPAGVMYGLGDARELLLAAALYHIDNGRFPATRQTRADANATMKIVPTSPDPRRGGAKYIPDPEQ
jgi:hypothetical protein